MGVRIVSDVETINPLRIPNSPKETDAGLVAWDGLATK